MSTGKPEGTNAAWSYSNPFPAVEKVKGRVAFYNELVDITVDGIAQERAGLRLRQPGEPTRVIAPAPENQQPLEEPPPG